MKVKKKINNPENENEKGNQDEYGITRSAGKGSALKNYLSVILAIKDGVWTLDLSFGFIFK